MKVTLLDKCVNYHLAKPNGNNNCRNYSCTEMMAFAANARRQAVEESIAIIEVIPTEGLRRQNLTAKLRALLPGPTQEGQ